MFFYRPWFRTPGDDERFGSDSNSIAQHFRHQSWGYGALMGITLAAGLLLNISFLASFKVNSFQRSHVPSMALALLSIRDLLVTLLIIPAGISWWVTNEGDWRDGEIWCKIASFFDFTLVAEYPLVLLGLVIALVTRKSAFSNLGDLPLQDYRTDDPLERLEIGSYASSVPGVTVTSPPSINGTRTAPSSIHSADIRRDIPGRGQGYHPRSVTGSIEGRLAYNRPSSRSYNNKLSNSFRTSSPLQNVAEEQAMDLWESASLEYPGRHNGSPTTQLDDYLNPIEPPPQFHGWHVFMLYGTWILALTLGIPAAILTQLYVSEDSFRQKSRCMIPVNAFTQEEAFTNSDPGYNFMFTNVLLTFPIASLAFIVLYGFLVFKKRTKNPKFKRFVKLAPCLFVVFIISRVPADQIQIQGFADALSGVKQLNTLPYETEYEILLLWAIFLPTFLNPILYFIFCSEYRRGSVEAWRFLFGCQSKMTEKELSIHQENLNESRTHETELL